MKTQIVIFLIFTVLIIGCTTQESYTKETANLTDSKIATFAGGCFWCVEADFEKLEGVKEVISGYSGGSSDNPTYKQVASGATDYIEAVQIYYDPAQVSYEELVVHLFKHIDPTDAGGSFVDRGSQYTSAVFYHDQEEKKIVEKIRDEMQKYFDKPIVTQIRSFEEFYQAEEYHQDFYKKNPTHYNRYRSGSGRDSFIKQKWQAS